MRIWNILRLFLWQRPSKRSRGGNPWWTMVTMAPSNFLSFYYSFILLNQRFFLYIIQVQVDPYLEDSMCDICRTTSGPFFCREESCFKYYCHSCWLWHHSIEGYRHHRSELTMIFIPNHETYWLSLNSCHVCQTPNSSVTVNWANITPDWSIVCGGAVVCSLVSMSDFQLFGWLFEVRLVSSLLCCFLRQETLLHIFSFQPGV